MTFNTIATDRHIYLKVLDTVANAPESLYIIGNLPKDRLPTVAIVGTRKPTAYGQEVAYKLAYSLAQQGVIIVSGLALGIDALAHRAAIEAGGTTIAVLPSLNAYPYSNRTLAAQIAKQGCLLSENTSQTQIFRGSFVKRNRLVSGISDGLLVVEATLKSGTLHTAAFARRQSKPVMVVPGNITSPASEGCNNLLKTGATAVTNVDDIVKTLQYQSIKKQTVLPIATNSEEKIILELIHQGVRDGDELQKQSKISAVALSQTLTMLELSGRIRSLGQNMWG